MHKIELSQVSKSYLGFNALTNVDLDLHCGEIHALMGENGAGKSTLIKILAGVIPSDSMKLIIDNKPVKLSSAQDSKLLGFRFIHQELNIVSHLSVGENMFLGYSYPKKYAYFIDWEKLNLYAKSALNELGILHINPRSKFGSLSIGDQMLCKIAGCLIGGEQNIANLYVFDEPTAALTNEESSKLFEVIKSLKRRGAAILYVSHRIGEVFDICDYVTVLRDGKKIFSETIAKTSAKKVISEMTGKEINHSYPKRNVPIGSKKLLELKNARTNKIGEMTFCVKSGEIVGVAGLSNSGQSDLLKMLLGIDHIKKGEVFLENKRYYPNKPHQAWTKGVSYIPKERRKEGLLLLMSVRSNTVLPHYSILSRLGFITDMIKEKRETLRLSKFVKSKFRSEEQPVNQLSGGNQQKILFSRATMIDPKLLLLDEPTRGVDIGAKFDIYNLIRKLSDKGCGIIISSSDLFELVGICDEIVVLQNNQQKTILKTKGLSAKKLLQSFYSVDAVLSQ